MKTSDNFISRLYKSKDQFWTLIWISGIAALCIWDMLFLNKPAFSKVITGFFNTFFIAFIVVILTLFSGWAITLALNATENLKNRVPFLTLMFVMNIIRSIPQIVGVLIAYVIIANAATHGTLKSGLSIFPAMGIAMCLFIVIELVDLMRERIDHFKKLDFYNAMRVCGISESRIINFHILWKNSRLHIFNKLISIFGSAVFLQCSVDFIISVGLSSDVNAVMLPSTLGSLLAKIDSKQDILAIGSVLTNPSYIPNLFTLHLQGLTVAFLIVFSLYCVYAISNGFAERHRL
jgi:ABC-type dipeptide/oligopeptide/nickel transport system permease component